MRILFIAPFIPWPLDHGGKIRIFNLIRQLARRHEVTLICLTGRTEPPLGLLSGICNQVIAVIHRPNAVASLTRFLLGANPYNVERYRSKALLAAILQVRSVAFDLVHIEMPQIWPCVVACEGLPVVLGTQNVEARILEQIANACRNPLKRILYRMETAKMRRFEEQAWRSCQLCLTVSDLERAEVISSGVEARRVVTVPNGVDLERFKFAARPGRKRLMFLGGLDYHPNLDALEWLLAKVWPRVREQVPAAELLLAGALTHRNCYPS